MKFSNVFLLWKPQDSRKRNRKVKESFHFYCALFLSFVSQLNYFSIKFTLDELKCTLLHENNWKNSVNIISNHRKKIYKKLSRKVYTMDPVDSILWTTIKYMNLYGKNKKKRKKWWMMIILDKNNAAPWIRWKLSNIGNILKSWNRWNNMNNLKHSG